MASRIDLQGLQKELDGFKSKIERWAQGVCSSSESLRDAHFHRIREFQGGALLASRLLEAASNAATLPCLVVTRLTDLHCMQRPYGAWSSSRSSCCGGQRK
jgi:hypothetical protein